MDDLLVIILTLIFAGIGALGQIKKKKRNQNEQPAEETQDNFWGFLDDEQIIQDDQKEEIVEEYQEAVQQPEKLVELVKKKPRTGYEFKAENEGTSIYGSDLTNDSKMVEKKVKKKKRDFSLRKAVIYSEILNRKYQ